MNLLSDRIVEDLDTVLDRDPSVTSRWEAALHPGFVALRLYWMSNGLYRRGHKVAGRLVTTVARIVTGIELHPGARVGRRVFIDHGLAVVVGETAIIGDDVTLFHQVTLGSTGYWSDPALGSRRHPEIGSGTVIGVGASVLGAVTIGRNVLIAANAVVTGNLPDGARVAANEKVTTSIALASHSV